MSYKKNVNANKQELSRKKRRTNEPTVLNLEDRSDMASINPNIQIIILGLKNKQSNNNEMNE